VRAETAALLERFVRSLLSLSFRPRTVMRSRLRCSLPARSGAPRCRESRLRNYCGPRVDAWCGNGCGVCSKATSSADPIRQSKESGAVTSPLHACGSPGVGRIALPGAQDAIDPVARGAVRLDPNSRFSDLGQPLCARTWSVDGGAAEGNGSAAILRFDAIHDAGAILGDGQIAALQFFQGTNTRALGG
jgi:hypothetical protein